MHHLFINLHVKYKYNNYLHTHTHAHAARSHTRSSLHLPFTKHRRFLQQTKYQKRANCGLRCHSQRSCSCQKHENRFLLTQKPQCHKHGRLAATKRYLTQGNVNVFEWGWLYVGGYVHNAAPPERGLVCVLGLASGGGTGDSNVTNTGVWLLPSGI